MAWIEVHDTLPDHPKVLRAARALKLDSDALVGKLVRLWTWALGNREDGVLSDLDAERLNYLMNYSGKSERLLDALTENRLLDERERGYRIHDWDEHVMMLRNKREENRKKSADRVRRFREKQKQPDVTACNALQERYTDEECNACNARTLPNQTNIDDIDPTTSILNARAQGEIHRLSTDDNANCGKTVENYGRELTQLDAMLLQGWEPHFEPDAIRYALDLADLYGAREPAQYASTVLAEWFRKGIRTEAEARAWREDRADDV